MKLDAEIRHDVEAELDWDPRFDSRNIGVVVKNGIVTLSGHVDTYPGSWAARGVLHVDNRIAVRP